MQFNLLRSGRWVLLVAGVCVSSFAAAAENRVNATLISDTEIAVAGSTIRVGVLFEMPARSHIYYRNPGDSGLATGVDWAEGNSLKAGDLQWPAPYQFEIEGLDNEYYFGYKGRVLLFSEFKVPDDAEPGSKITIGAKVYWLLCLDDGVCIPEDGMVEITIPVEGEARKAYESTVFDRWAERIPVAAEPGQISWSTTPKPMLEVKSPEGLTVLDSIGSRIPDVLRFIPDEGSAWRPRIPPIGNRSVAEFTPKYKGDKATGGVLILPLKNDHNFRTLRYLVVPAPETP